MKKVKDFDAPEFIDDRLKAYIDMKPYLLPDLSEDGFDQIKALALNDIRRKDAHSYQALLLKGFLWYLEVDVRKKPKDYIIEEFGTYSKNTCYQLFKICLELPRMRFWIPEDKSDITNLIKHRTDILDRLKEDPWWTEGKNDENMHKEVEGHTIVNPDWLISKV